MLSIDNFGVS